uniref:HORMA domain-containing protein n=1 Tax=Caenorhabditis japonica TaxID=281687 RepID=A0A8R1DQV5_CAEJA
MAPFEAREMNDSLLNQNVSRDSVHDSKWIQLFPRCVADKNKSSNFMTRAMFVAFSMILNRRGILGPEHFATNYITEKLKMKSLNFHHPKSLKISECLRSAGEAIKLGFLDELALVITEREGDEKAIEVFSFKVHYFPDGGVAAILNTEANGSRLTPFQKLTRLDYEGTPSVRDQLVLLVRSIMVICQKVLQPLPSKFSSNFRINYTDETPEGFRVDGFNDSPIFYTHHDDMQAATLGPLRPGYHGALFDCSSIFINDSFEAETTLQKYIAKAADDMGYSSYDSLYGSFATQSDVNSNHTQSPDVQRFKSAQKEESTRPRTRRAHATRTTPYSKDRRDV